MTKNQLLVCSALVAAGALASPALAAPKIEKNAVVAAPAATDPVGFEVYLPLRNQAAMQALLKAQQTPGSPQYHQWLTPAQFAAQFGPTAESLANVKAALTAAGLTVTATHSQSVHVAGDAQHAAALLKTSLAKVTQVSGSSRLVAMTAATMPNALKAEGAMIAAFAPTPTRKATAIGVRAAAVPENRNTTTGAYWFDDDKQAYSYPAYTNVTALPGGYNRVNTSNGYGVNVAVLMSDLIFPGDVAAAFNHENFTAISGAPIPNVSTVLVNGGGVYNGGGSFEASLDVQQVTGGAPGSNVTLVSIPDLSDGNIIDGYTYIVESNAYAIVNSSFGGCELEYTAAYNGGTDLTYILQIEHNIYVQGNLQGITFSASSGDNGAPMCPGPGYAPGVNSTFGLGVSTPADDPNVTAVGGGNLITTRERLRGSGISVRHLQHRGRGLRRLLGGRRRRQLDLAEAGLPEPGQHRIEQLADGSRRRHAGRRARLLAAQRHRSGLLQRQRHQLQPGRQFGADRLRRRHRRRLLLHDRDVGLLARVRRRPGALRTAERPAGQPELLPVHPGRRANRRRRAQRAGRSAVLPSRPARVRRVLFRQLPVGELRLHLRQRQSVRRHPVWSHAVRFRRRAPDEEQPVRPREVT
jgi:Pro-kumamolisin, activation domain